MKSFFTQQVDFFGNTTAEELVKKYGSPLYVYNESILRKRCRDMATLSDCDTFRADYSTKANSNMHLLKIIHEEGLEADAMSPGEIQVLLAAGFAPEEILYVCNNVSASEMEFAVSRGITVSIDAISQLETFGQRFPGHKVAIRVNMGYGAGHHEKVVTAGKKTKFGINDDRMDEVKEILNRYQLKLVGINQHIGSLFMEETAYVTSAGLLMKLALQFPDLEFVDFGGGFGIPYKKQDGQQPMDLQPCREKLTKAIEDFTAAYGRKIKFKTEPGRYIAAECGVLLGTVYAKKDHGGIQYVGTDLGFNVLQRPILYDSHHDIEVYRGKEILSENMQTVTVVGNICESGDKLAVNRDLPQVELGDIMVVMDAGAYGYSMASNYNNRLRPAEVLIDSQGNDRLIRRRDTFEDLMRGFDV